MSGGGGYFSPDALNKVVHDTLDQAMAALPAGKNNALLIDAQVGGENSGARALWVHRAGDNWQIALEGDYDGPHKVAGKVATAIYW